MIHFKLFIAWYAEATWTPKQYNFLNLAAEKNIWGIDPRKDNHPGPFPE